MKRILVVFLLLISFNLSAAEVGRIFVEFRDYNKSGNWLVPAEYQKYKYQEFEIHISHTFKPGTPEFIEYNQYLDRYSNNTIGLRVLSKNLNGIKLVTQYLDTEAGRWRPLWRYFPILFGQKLPQEPEVYNCFDVQARLLLRILNEDYNNGKYSFETINDINHEEFYWLLEPVRVDENGVRHNSYKVEFIFSRE
jgi:hypothetical protein